LPLILKKNVNNEKLDFMILLENCLVEALKGKKKKKKKTSFRRKDVSAGLALYLVYCWAWKLERIELD
jgi:hypothetical protein